MVVMRKRKADEVVTLSAHVEKWIKTELWEEKAREVVKEEREEEKVVKEESGEEEMEEGPITHMPPEILDVIFSILPHKDLCTAMAVCSLWNSIGGRPYMWAKYRGLGKVRPRHSLSS